MKQEFCIDLELDRPHSDEEMPKEAVKLFIQSAIQNHGMSFEDSKLKETTAVIGYINLFSDIEGEQIEGLGEEDIEGS